MAIANADLNLFQWGVESTAGTAVAATSRIGVEELTFTPLDNVARPRVAAGVIVRSPGHEIADRRATTWAATGPANFAELQHWLGMAVLHDAVPVGAAPYTWTHTFNPAALNVLSTRTFERRLSDGSNFIDNEWAYAFCNTLSLDWSEGLLGFSAGGMARRIQSSTLTAAQTLTAPDFEPSSLSIVDIDSTWGTLGTTNIVGQVLSWGLTWNNGQTPKWTADGRTDLDYTTVLVNGQEVSLEARIRMLVKADSGQFATEKTAAEAQTLRAVQIQVSGAGNEDLTLKFLGKHTAGSLEIAGEEDGQVVVDIVLQEATDGTNLFEAILINDVATLV